MFPWGHIAVGYLCYSLFAHLRGRTPSGPATIALVVGTQFPDLVDKPLSWSFDLLPAGVLAHTVFFALPFVALCLLIAHRFSHTELAVAFSVGYLSHLPADVVPSVVFSEETRAWFLFWPVIPRPADVDVSNPVVGPGAGAGLLENAAYYFHGYVENMFSSQGLLYVGIELAILGAIFALWLYDGHPGTEVVGRAVGRVVGRSSS